MPASSPAPTELTGPITRAEVAFWRDALAEAVARDGGLTMDLGASGPWDMAGVQMLVSAMISVERAGGVVRMTRAPKIFLNIIERAALSDRFASAIES